MIIGTTMVTEPSKPSAMCYRTQAVVIEWSRLAIGLLDLRF